MVMDFTLKFLELPPPKAIDIDRIREFISDTSVKRIHFATTHSSALSPFPDGKWYLKLPFKDSFEPIVKAKLQIHGSVLFTKDDKYHRVIQKEEYEKFENLITEVKDIVFLRDCLDLSIALCLHETDPNSGERTELGEHEYQLKYHPGSPEASVAFGAITYELQSRLETLPYFKYADYIMAVPSSHTFLKEILQKLNGFGFTDISSQISWINKTRSLKELSNPNEKLDLIDTWGFKIDPNINLTGKSVLVIDDMYKSGITMQYIGMKLKDAGASRVFGICICKALGNN